MARAQKKPKGKPAVRIHTITLTAAAAAALRSLSQDATDYTGRKVSSSALIRGLLRLAQHQGTPWLYKHVCPHVEAEMQEGLRWGNQEQSQR